VILLVIDTLRPDHLSGYGYPRQTSPTLDRLMSEGVRFENAIAPSSWSAPSHVTIVTGAAPERHRVFAFGQPLAEGTTPLAVRLKDAGYATGMFSTHLALHRGVGGITKGLDHRRLLRNERDAEALYAAAEWATAAAGPYFLYICLMSPHAPYTKHPAYYDQAFFTDPPPFGDRRYPFVDTTWLGDGGIPRSVRIGDHDQLGFYVNRYDRGIRYVDDLIGQFWETLRTAGKVQDTILVVTSDHGEGLGDHDIFAHELHLYDFLVRVPLMFRYPDVIRAGGVWSPQVGSADIVPTLLGLIGLEPQSELDGVDLSEHLIRGDRPKEKRILRGSYRFRGFERFMVRSDTHKLILDVADGSEEFYDLTADPTEDRNLLPAGGRPPESAASIYAELREAVKRLVATHAGIPAPTESQPLDPEVVEELRALGYLDP
jgi:arylsulfatase A-like enzyme